MNYNKVSQYEQNILKKHQSQLQTNNEDIYESDDKDIDELLEILEDELEDNETYLKYREKRLQEISEHVKKIEENVKFDNYGILDTIDEESNLIKICSEIDKIVIHFQLDTFPKCKYMNDQLAVLAQKYLCTKFVKINATNCPFLTKSLHIKVLPFLIGYHRGKEVMRLIGFSKLGNNPDKFPIESLEFQLRLAGLLDSGIESNSPHQNNRYSKNYQNGKYVHDDDSESDLDI